MQHPQPDYSAHGQPWGSQPGEWAAGSSTWLPTALLALGRLVIERPVREYGRETSTAIASPVPVWTYRGHHRGGVYIFPCVVLWNLSLPGIQTMEAGHLFTILTDPQEDSHGRVGTASPAVTPGAV